MSLSTGLIFIVTTDPYIKFLRRITDCVFDVVGFYFSSNLSGYVETHLFLHHLLTGESPSWSDTLDKVKKLPFIRKIIIRPFKGGNTNDFKIKFLSVKRKGTLNEHLDQILYYIVSRDLINHPFNYYYDFLKTLGVDHWTNYFSMPQIVFLARPPKDKWIIGDNYNNIINEIIRQWFRLFTTNEYFRRSFIKNTRPNTESSTMVVALKKTTSFLEQMLQMGTIATNDLIDQYQMLKFINKSSDSYCSLLVSPSVNFPINVNHNIFIRTPSINEEKIYEEKKDIVKFEKPTHIEDINELHSNLKKIIKNIEQHEPSFLNLNVLIRLCNQLASPLNLDTLKELPPLTTQLTGYTTEYPSFKLNLHNGSSIILSTSDPDISSLSIEQIKEIGILLEGADFRFDYLRGRIARHIARENLVEI